MMKTTEKEVFEKELEQELKNLAKSWIEAKSIKAEVIKIANRELDEDEIEQVYIELAGYVRKLAEIIRNIEEVNIRLVILEKRARLDIVVKPERLLLNAEKIEEFNRLGILVRGTVISKNSIARIDYTYNCIGELCLEKYIVEFPEGRIVYIDPIVLPRLIEERDLMIMAKELIVSVWI